MPAIKSFLLIAALACGTAAAYDRPPKVGETRDPPKDPPAVTEKQADPVRKGEPAPEKSTSPAPKDAPPAEKAAEPDKTDPNKANPTKDERKKPPVKRRAVHAVIESTPRIGPSYGPVLNHPAPRPGLPPMPVTVPSPPVTIGNCVGGNCTDTNGTQYNGGVGNALLSPSGRLCNNNGGTVSCF